MMNFTRNCAAMATTIGPEISGDLNSVASIPVPGMESFHRLKGWAE